MLSLGPSPTILPVSVDIRVQQLPGVVLHMLLDTGSTNSSLFLDAIDILGTQVTLKLWPVVPTEQIEPLFTLPISASGKVVTKYGTSVRPYVRLDVSLVNHNAQIPSKNSKCLYKPVVPLASTTESWDWIIWQVFPISS